MKKELNKNDRRYAYTHGVIKDAMLELLHETSFIEITVSALCRQAQVGRATFYTHYNNLTEVIEELVEDAIKATDRSSAKSVDGMREVARYLNTDHGLRELESKILLLPICQRVADNPKYNVLFKDTALSEYILSMIYRQEKDYQIAVLMKYGMTEKEAYVFIERMKKYGDIWEYDEVIRLYKDKGLEEAIEDRKFDIAEFSSITGMVIDEEDAY